MIQNFSSFQLFAATIMVSVLSLSLQLPCSNVHLHVKSRKILRRLHRDFLFVEKPFAPPQSTLGIPRRVSRDVTVQMPGTSRCPWSWAQDDNPDRVPRFLTKAVCPDCAHFCRSVSYHHRGLVQRCDVKTGQTVWKWTQVELPVAFIYDP